ncbi:NAD-dependent epimerase/dehydratase family protein [Evansella clarkii]|uniref:NAD-dependent epimerase/dehydratase family protein n=1 Tax=Evansella clarkii TaxID=79879 RepID=UPI000B439860|nr:NAD-dependent epimerase/dehydratase family protein [Evansella clarkii]
MRRILVLGGTRFFGKRLVQKLLDNGDDVTIATRGETDDPFGDDVQRIKVDRFSRESMEKAFSGDDEWDLIYDQICFSPDDAHDACEVFKFRVKKYILTSTLSVYNFDSKAKKEEKDFNPYDCHIKYGRKDEFSYGEGKRLAEAVFFRNARFPVLAVRPPIVLGRDDYTERLHYYVRKVLSEEVIGLDNTERKASFVESEDLAQFLFWAGFKEDFTGPVNASSPDQLSLKELLTIIEEKTGKAAKVASPDGTVKSSPMNFPVSIYQDVSLAEAEGYKFKKLSEWFEPLTEWIVKEEKAKQQ